MSLVQTSLQLQLQPRKRTSSFSLHNPAFAPSPRPAKAPRISTDMGASLRRTESYISLVDAAADPAPAVPSTLPYQRTLRYYKDQRALRKATLHSLSTTPPLTIRIRPDPPRPTTPTPTPTHTPKSTPTPTPAPKHKHKPKQPQQIVGLKPTPPPTPARQSSPLAPKRAILPARPHFPRSRPEPDLLRKAIRTCMRASPEGQHILRMGPRLALATRELERLVAGQSEPEDVVMADATSSPPTQSEQSAPQPLVLSKSWVVVGAEDWEMVDCAA
ncbi:hypothetical protein H0H81_011748 [Sphagnurus paluster]|uniref:Uncharacterized protein n=1 Tax=Sphagnurus paluster TaxID=117069 RepID=A0A9P7GP64_9AGAR|nr:hypothetical protein H0H81_011748 [Sphagnurus paluster]